MRSETLTSISVIALILLCTYSGCSLLPSPKETLPPATQTGANTFGCYVNGKLWVPKGYDGTPNYSVSYDPTFWGGALNISSYRYYGSGNTDEQNMTIYLDSASSIGVYPLYTSHNRGAIFSDWNKCTYQNDNTSTYKIGIIEITKLDLQNGIVSGTFQFTLFKPGCDTIKVTDGRFDKKL